MCMALRAPHLCTGLVHGDLYILRVLASVKHANTYMRQFMSF
jgi:hypothetical protein